MAGYMGYQWTVGTAKAEAGQVDQAVLAAPGDGKRIYLVRGFVAVTELSSGIPADNGRIFLEDGENGTVLAKYHAGATNGILGVFQFDFGDGGYPLSLNTKLNLTSEGASQIASARCTAIGYIV